MTATNPTWNHKGHAITTTSGGKFATTVDGKLLTAGSLAGLKKKLDTPPKFAPFNCLYEKYFNTGHESVAVVNIQKRRGRFNTGTEWVLANGNVRQSVIEDTPQNRAILAKLRKMRDKFTAEKEANDKTLSALEQTVTRRETPK